MTELNKIIDDLGRTVEEFKSTNDARLKELEKKGSNDVLTTEKLNKLNDRITEIDSIKTRLEQAETALARRNVSDSKGLSQEQSDYNAAFEHFVRKGESMSPEKQKALSVGSDADGGYLVSTDTSGRMIKQIYETSPMRQVASIQVIGTDSLDGMYDTDEASAGWVSETGGRTATNTPQLGKWNIPVHELYANPQATQKLLDDADINVEAWLADKIANKMARIENTAFVSGDGVGKPRGFLTYAAGTDISLKQIEQVNAGASGAFKAAPDGGDIFFNIIGKLKQGYRTGAQFYMGRTTVAAARLLKDSNGAYVWRAGIEAGQAQTLAGFGITEFEDMPALAANSLSIAFGNMREAYQIVDRAGVRVLRDPYTNKPYVSFYTVKRTGGAVVNFEALKLVKFAV